ncbi:hypothetical protein EXIGLDRAFT_766515 [Exidia glandulosa HHB12029]|uniref:Mmc1 C-terminal domain-containing protein n=1 Tax=Exidia glandulosa HHB12029 TaxID=1314781 RepID=A0A165JP21_EXIGL|nr:hypothetical protein EXIGLDRAFT_766515 [Exidia glandulosa HHB12029]
MHSALGRAVRRGPHRPRSFNLARCAHTNADLLARAIPVLHDVQSLASRALPPGSSTAQRWDTLTRWATNEALGILEHGRSRPAARIGVLEWDPAGRAKEVVSALLDDPLSSDDESRTVLRDRWKGQTGVARLLIRHGPQSGHDAGGLSLASSWLRRTNAELLEISRKDDAAVLDFLQTDVPLIVLSGLQLHAFPLIDTLRLHPRARLIINSPLCTSDRGCALLATALREHLGVDASKNGFVHMIDSNSVTRALDAIRDTRDPRAVQTFQEHYMASRIAPLIDWLESESGASHRERAARVAVFVSRAAVRDCGAAAGAARADVQAVKATAQQLQADLIAEKVRASTEILGTGGQETVASEVKKAEGRVREVMQGLQWWQVPLNVDDLGYIVKRAVDSAWCSELEKRLAFHAGLLQSAKTRFESRTDEIVESLPTEYRSSILLNELDQMRALPSAHIARDTLSAPITTRRELISAPTSFLHRRAQRLVLTTSTLSFGGALGSYAAWATHYIDGATAVGVAALLSVAVLRWSIGRWEKAQKLWWADWTRVGEGLARDVQRDFLRAMNERVFIVPQRLCDRLQESIEQREKTIAEVENELEKTKRVADGLAE